MYLLKEQLQIKETCGPRKGTSTDLHINWNAHTHQLNGELEH